MKKIVFNLLFLVILFPLFIFAQEAAMDPSLPSSDGGVSVPTDQSSTGEAPIEPIVSNPVTTSSKPAPVEPTAPKLTPASKPKTTPTPTSIVEGTTSIVEPVSPLSTPKNYLGFILGTVAVGFGTLLFIKLNSKKNKDDDKKCRNIKKLIENKLNELTDWKGQLVELAKKESKEQIKSMVSNTPSQELLILIEKGNEEYSRLKKLYEECIIDIDVKNTEGAFKWIVGLLQKHSIPFQISGGLAARLYGSTRDLADIDIGIPDDRFDDLYRDVKQYIIYGPERYLDDEWDLKLMTLKYQGQEIDIAGRDNIKIFDKSNKIWTPAHRDLTISEDKEVYGIIVPVIPKESLIAYKSKIARYVDLEDIRQLEIHK